MEKTKRKKLRFDETTMVVKKRSRPKLNQLIAVREIETGARLTQAEILEEILNGEIKIN